MEGFSVPVHIYNTMTVTQSWSYDWDWWINNTGSTTACFTSYAEGSTSADTGMVLHVWQVACQ